MFDTVKKRLLFLTTALLLIFCILITFFSLIAFRTNRNNRNATMKTKVEYIAEKIDNDYEYHNEIVHELALTASVFYQTKNKDKNILISTLKNNYKEDIPEYGVGIWFDEYVINPAKKWFCIFAYKKDGNIAFNNSLENEEYNYQQKYWYTFIKDQAKKGIKNIYKPTTCAATGRSNYVLTIGSGIFANNKLIGIITADWKIEDLSKGLAIYKPTKNSYILLADKDNDFIIALTNANKTGHSLNELTWYRENLKTGDVIKDGNIFYRVFLVSMRNGLILFVNIPLYELYGEIYAHLFIVTFLMLLSVILVALIMYRIITKNVNKPIQYLVDTAQKIGEGDLETKMEIKEPAEFAQLASAFNKMTTDIKDYITNLNIVTTEKKKMEEELSIANSIQSSSLPSEFPPYPDRKEFDVFANMVPAKEVGGDFYDFFFVDKNNFVFLIADVSGKGVPAALFMMETKTLLRNIIKTGLPLDEAITKVNHKICKKNKQGFFVTAFIAKIDLSNGQINFVNAGHNPPLLKRNEKHFTYLETESNLVLGAIDEFLYKQVEDKLSVGDEMFLYTDGVTEATNKELELFGENRLFENLNQNKDTEIEQIIPNIKQTVYDFMGEEKQSDDITTLVFKYKGQEEICNSFETFVTSFLLPANIELYPKLSDWIDGLCNRFKMQNTYKNRLYLAIEEIFTNISTYAYPPKEGDVKVVFKSLNPNEIEVQFIDSGTPYNPLEKPDPNINASVDERAIGGLGIYITKNSMDYMEYEFTDNKNILTMRLKYEQTD